MIITLKHKYILVGLLFSYSWPFDLTEQIVQSCQEDNLVVKVPEHHRNTEQQ